MAIFSNSIIPAAAAADDDVVTKSLRFNLPDSPHLSRTFGTGTSTTVFTYSLWVKMVRSSPTNGQYILDSEPASGDEANLCITGSAITGGANHIQLAHWDSSAGALGWYVRTDALFRDYAGWYHFTICVDTGESGADTVKIWQNGNLLSHATASYPSGNHYWNEAVVHNFGRWESGEERHYDGYLADAYFIDGVALTPTSFAEEDATTGQWKPKAYDTADGAYGNNGFHLDFADSADIGNDVSGEGNDFTATNLAPSDVVLDNPSAGSNFCTWNPISGPPRPATTFSEGNLKVVGNYSTHFPRVMGTMLVSTGKWFHEIRCGSTQTTSREYGFKGHQTSWPVSGGSHGLAGGSAEWDTNAEFAFSAYHEGIKFSNSGSPATSGTTWGTDGDIIGLALDLDSSTRTLRVFKNGSEVGTATDIPAGGSDDWVPALDPTSASPQTSVANFGQDATFNGNESGTTYTTDASDDDTGGEFTMQPPAGYKAWTTANLPTPTIAKPAEHFDTKIWTGSTTNNTDDRDITGLLFEPDLIWYKSRTDATHHCVQDSVRADSTSDWGNTKLGTDDSAIERAAGWHQQYGYIKSSISGADTANGFKLGWVDGGDTQDVVHTNMSAKNYVAWAWKAGTTPSVSSSYTHTLTLELEDSADDGWGDGTYDTPRLEVIEGTESLGYATVTASTATYTIETNNKDAIKIVWEWEDMMSGELDEQVAELKEGSTVIQDAWTTDDTVTDGEVWITQSTSTNESTTGTLTLDDGSGESYNADAGFSIIKWTGDSTSSGSQEVSHSLDVAPELIIAKNRTDVQSYGYSDWIVYHKSLDSGDLIKLNSTDEAFTPSYTTVISGVTNLKVDFDNDDFDYSGYLNYGEGAGVDDTYVAYLFASKAGFSSVGTYEGNGLADGTFVYCGFSPAWIMVKSIDEAYSWYIHDTARSPYNYSDLELTANSSGAEYSVSGAGAGERFDILSNGFKNRTTNIACNESDKKYIYAAFAEAPFKYANAR